MSKWQILAATATAGGKLMIGIVVFVALNSVLSLGYYVPVINRLYRVNVSDTVLAGQRVQWVMVLPMIILALGIVVIGIWPVFANFITYNAAASLMYPFGL
jgi:NADH:ubiquinone oxidoreductase subunit 2 (subunit N)